MGSGPLIPLCRQAPHTLTCADGVPRGCPRGAPGMWLGSPFPWGFSSSFACVLCAVWGRVGTQYRICERRLISALVLKWVPERMRQSSLPRGSPCWLPSSCSAAALAVASFSRPLNSGSRQLPQPRQSCEGLVFLGHLQSQSSPALLGSHPETRSFPGVQQVPLIAPKPVCCGINLSGVSAP